ncbi:acyl-CoA carboxylase subunit epsilon [Phytoactinopolyspora alkaliphila]|uniref:Acyl-CoA carboxylase subunit epsilon n=1 Tax=Phytoactinopolyspora alkaliphila TaxID=1783498 RepID=A0A6N9YJP8_9ACTN|nr:acyl-CoA carboxylase subunit epsilon [Phytoactinopolyspora alkaliphila]NED95182.1 acyl-CoA carboxylase subunit epsilon [Phytoactinopolyspora alkaliphila]
MSEESEPLIRVVQGDPTAEELAALTAVVSAKAAEASSAASAGSGGPRPSTWSAYWRTARAPMRAGPGGWRASALPRS